MVSDRAAEAARPRTRGRKIMVSFEKLGHEKSKLVKKIEDDIYCVIS
jgi:hypothetical protein